MGTPNPNAVQYTRRGNDGTGLYRARYYDPGRNGCPAALG